MSQVFNQNTPNLPRLNLSSSRSDALSCRPNNPFVMTPEDVSFEGRAIKSERDRQEKFDFLSLGIVERTKKLTSRAPTTYRSVFSVKQPSRPQTVRIFDRTKFHRKRNIKELMSDKRDIFLMQLILDRKNKRIETIDDYMESEEKNHTETIDDIQKESDSVSKEIDNVERKLSQAKKEMEVAVRLKVDLLKEFDKQKQKVEIMRSEVSKNQDMLKFYRNLRGFMHKMSQASGNTLDYFKDPDAMVKAIDDLVNENLFIGQQLDFFDEFFNSDSKNTEEEGIEIDRTLEALNKLIEVNLPPEEFTHVADRQQKEANDNELARLSGLVGNTVIKLLGPQGVLTPLEMLEKLEWRLEEFYKKLTMVNPSFVAQKQAMIDELRAEEYRKEIAKERERIFQEKKDQAYARATKPIKKRVGRRLVERTVPKRRVVQSDAEKLRKEEERLRLRRLLFEEYDF